jgi:hypothetical protein
LICGKGTPVLAYSPRRDSSTPTSPSRRRPIAAAFARLSAPHALRAFRSANREHFERFVRAEYEKWGAVIRRANVRAE